MLELLKQLGYSLERDIHLLMPIEDFVHKKEIEFQTSDGDQKNKWEFIIKPDKSKVWLNKFSRMESKKYPYLEELKEEIWNFENNIQPEVDKVHKKLKTEVNVFDFIYVDKQEGKLAVAKIRRQVLNVRIEIFTKVSNI